MISPLLGQRKKEEKIKDKIRLPASRSPQKLHLHTEDKESEQKRATILDKDKTGIFELGLGYGAKYYSHSQSGVLGTSKIGTLFLNNFSFKTSYQKGNYKLEMQAGSYNFKYDVSGLEQQKQLYQYALRLSWKSFSLGLSVEQQPLFKNLSSGIEMIGETSILPTIGYQWNYNLSTEIETNFHLQVTASYLMSASASDPNVKISDVKGFGGDISTRLERRLNRSKRYPLYYYWDNGVSYRDYKRNVSWGGAKGSVNSDHLYLNSTVGIQLDFKPV